MASRYYRFISDPDHKENLSGRVRAACLTCRRKKIKCDGEVPCQTCREKGVLCEGLTERKRPIKTSDRQRSLDASNAPAHLDAPSWQHANETSHPRAVTSQPSNQSKRPEVIRIDTFSSDSSASSGQQSRPSEWADSIDPHQHAMYTPNSTYDNISPFGVGGMNWNMSSGQNMGSYSGSDMMSGEQNFRNQMSEEQPSPGWQDRVEGVSWPSADYRNQEASELLSAAKMLEAHAQSLRWLASEQHAQNLNDGRMQTVYNEFNSTRNNSSGQSSDDMAMAMDRLSHNNNNNGTNGGSTSNNNNNNSNNANSGYSRAPVCDCSSWMDGNCPHWKRHGQTGT